MQQDDPNHNFVFDDEGIEDQIGDDPQAEAEKSPPKQIPNHPKQPSKAKQGPKQQNKDSKPSTAELGPQTEQQGTLQPDDDHDFVFLEQNAYSFRKAEFAKPAQNPEPHENKPKSTQKNANLIAGIQKEQDDLTKQKSHHLKRNRHSQSQASNISNSDIISESNKLATRHDANPIVQGMFVEPSEQENHKTEEPIQAEKAPPVSLIKDRKAARVNRRKLAPLQETQNGKITVNSSNVQLIGNQSSILQLEPNPQQNTAANDNRPSVNRAQDMAVALTRVPLLITTNFNFIRQRKCCSYPVYSLALKDMSLIVNAKKEFGHINSYYNITCQPKAFGLSNSYLGYLKGNFSGTQFNLFQTCLGKDELTCTICYKAELTCNAAFRKIEIFIRSEDAPYNTLEGSEEASDLEELYEVGQNSSLRKIVKIVSKKPEWSEFHNCYLLDLKGRSRMGSVKNMALIQQGQSAYKMLFCKTEIDQFHLELSHPLSPFIGLGILLSSFDFKLFCQ